jgi:23S rRNA pseudouridine955/2504/2580 synthase
MSIGETKTVATDEAGMRLDRWFKLHFPQMTHAYLSKLTRTGQVRVDGARAKTGTRLAAGQKLRVPPLRFETRPADKPRAAGPLPAAERAFFNKLLGLQGWFG